METKPVTPEDSVRKTPLNRAIFCSHNSNIDNQYEGNRLVFAYINRLGYDFNYDDNGNMIYDGHKGVNISYNLLNLPEKIGAGSDEVSYIYTAGGVKLATKFGSSTTYYRGSFVYNNDELDHIIHPEGIIRKTSGAYVYYYAKKDHLGSTRILCHAANGKMMVDQGTDYYTFGLAHQLRATNTNRYLFSGKELQDQYLNGSKLMLYDFGARNYDPTIGRWFNIDPLAAKYFSMSPYVYCANNPINFIDPDGMDWYEFKDKEKRNQILWRNSQDKKYIDDDGTTWDNIGANYSYTIGNTTYNYVQNELNSMSVSVLDKGQFQTQFDTRFGDESRQNVACKRACDVMLANAGTTSAGRNDATQQVGREVGMAENHSIIPTSNLANGNKILVREVELNGNPIIVGVDRGIHGRGINDGTTDHWIVVTGYTYNSNGTTSYNYFDPGNRNTMQGTNATNVLTRTINGLLINTNTRRTYTVTNIRPNTR